jgi:radical SAM family uncharacterized protein
LKEFGPDDIRANLERILPDVTKPARYTGHELNAVVKDWEATDLRLALIYPDTYEIGMSNLGLAILYDLVNKEAGMLAERAYAPWPDMEEKLRETGIPLFSLETYHPLRDFDLLGFSLQYELTYTNILNMLDLAGIPIHASARGPGDPLVMAGGSGSYNPEPLADFIDLFVVGDGEEALIALLALYRNVRKEHGGMPSGLTDTGRQAFLRRAAQIDGVYVPSLYEVEYAEDGRVVAVTPQAGAPERVLRQMVYPLPPAPTHPVVPYIETIHDRAMIEIQRGCTSGCRFCQAGMIYRPVRERSVDEILETAEAILDSTGYGELALLSLSSADYSQIGELLTRLSAQYDPSKMGISLPSLRLDTFTIELAEMIQTKRKTGLTFAPEAGSQRLRDVINKNIQEEDLLQAAQMAFERGWDTIKLYFMLGLPTETDEDVDAIAELVSKVYRMGRQERGRRTRINVSASTFVPKPHTPFQWLPLADLDTIETRQGRLRNQLRQRGIKLSWHAPESTLLEAVLCRGDRRLGQVIEGAWRNGARFDAWREHFSIEPWLDAFAQAEIHPYFYSSRERGQDEVFPWSHISCGVNRAYLWKEYECARQGDTTPDCREGCQACGLRANFELAHYPPVTPQERI